MKKRLFFVLSILCLSLSSCVSFSNEQLSEGLNFSDKDSEEESINTDFYTGDSLPLTANQIMQIKFSSSESEGKYISTKEELESTIDNYENVITSLNSTKYVSQGFNGLKIGISSSKTFAKLDIDLSRSFKYVEIIACPRISYVFDYSLNKTVCNIDTDTSLKVNEKKFIQIKNISEEDIDSNDYMTKMVFLVEETSNLKLYEYNNRAIIQSITFYSEI